MPNINPNRLLRVSVVLVDVLLILLAYVVSFRVAANFTLIEQRNIDSFVNLLPWILLLGIFFIVVFELDRLVHHDLLDLTRKLVVASGFIMIITIAMSFLFREFSLPRSVIFLAHAFMFLFLFAWKGFIIKCNQFTKGKAVIIGDRSEYENIKHSIRKLVTKKEKVDFIDMNTNYAAIKAKLDSYDIVFISSTVHAKVRNEVLYLGMRKNKNIYVIPTVSELVLMKSSIASLDDTMLLQVKPFYINGVYLFIKRVVDILFSLVLLLISLPVMLATVVAIKLEDGGSVFFKQERLGKFNKPFNILKFRSMKENAESETGPTLAKSNDARITKVGHFIRLTRIDELPQLINVLKGEMSIVGPRPERYFFAENFQKENIWFKTRCAVKPGITGYAQIMGNYTTDMNDKLKFDLHYIRNYSLWLDMVIFLRTILVVINKAKADGEQVEPKKVKMVLNESKEVR
ncbi:sugar transferase [Halalkalibacter krulwichiae]|uniref:UDP-N-acetylgalactosamine-undecaprenyl-phosphate N-acetylgalactosaminephosphotransferase n=1 Tax=Halalkalibacter krulwichiae TaxID=199441 RepID=A0A1X9MFH4_9BACI|nr:sugar transferase [Halalkalibacter krulwichiae]ARK32207.1 UDP-N-acetylgalactosamine-undecaprenyl-phosphate N-acetylgalactosaminephosphotransferase [Halalkalibacter krulwichiae]